MTDSDALTDLVPLTKTPTGLRSIPQQARGRRQFEAILNEAANQLAHLPSAEVTTKSIAKGVGISIATLYRYFDDRDAIVLALTRRDLDEMGGVVMGSLLEASGSDLDNLIRTSMEAYRDNYIAKPLFVKIYLRGRQNESLARYGDEYNRQLAALLRDFAISEKAVRDDMPFEAALLVIELGDRIFQTAFNDDGTHDPAIVEYGIRMLQGALREWSTSVTNSAAAPVPVGCG